MLVLKEPLRSSSAGSRARMPRMCIFYSVYFFSRSGRPSGTVRGAIVRELPYIHTARMLYVAIQQPFCRAVAYVAYRISCYIQWLRKTRRMGYAQRRGGEPCYACTGGRSTCHTTHDAPSNTPHDWSPALAGKNGEKIVSFKLPGGTLSCCGICLLRQERNAAAVCGTTGQATAPRRGAAIAMVWYGTRREKNLPGEEVFAFHGEFFNNLFLGLGEAK